MSDTTNLRRTALGDQVDAASAETATALIEFSSDTRSGNPIDGHHPVEAVLAARLASELAEHDHPICEHLPAGMPARLLWSPGMQVLGCDVDYPAFVEQLEQEGKRGSCDACGRPDPDHIGGWVSAVGPVTLVAAVCDTCLAQPETETASPVLTASCVFVATHLLNRYAT